MKVRIQRFGRSRGPEVGRPAQALADAHVARPFAAALAVGEGVEVGFFRRFAEADVAAEHQRFCGGFRYWVGTRCPTLVAQHFLSAWMMLSVLWPVSSLGRGAEGRPLHGLAVGVYAYLVGERPLPLAGWQRDDLSGD